MPLGEFLQTEPSAETTASRPPVTVLKRRYDQVLSEGKREEKADKESTQTQDKPVTEEETEVVAEQPWPDLPTYSANSHQQELAPTPQTTAGTSVTAPPTTTALSVVITAGQEVCTSATGQPSGTTPTISSPAVLAAAPLSTSVTASVSSHSVPTSVGSFPITASSGSQFSVPPPEFLAFDLEDASLSSLNEFTFIHDSEVAKQQAQKTEPDKDNQKDKEKETEEDSSHAPTVPAVTTSVSQSGEPVGLNTAGSASYSTAVGRSPGPVIQSSSRATARVLPLRLSNNRFDRRKQQSPRQALPRQNRGTWSGRAGSKPDDSATPETRVSEAATPNPPPVPPTEKTEDTESVVSETSTTDSPQNGDKKSKRQMKREQREQFHQELTRSAQISEEEAKKLKDKHAAEAEARKKKLERQQEGRKRTAEKKQKEKEEKARARKLRQEEQERLRKEEIKQQEAERKKREEQEQLKREQETARRQAEEKKKKEQGSGYNPWSELFRRTGTTPASSQKVSGKTSSKKGKKRQDKTAEADNQEASHQGSVTLPGQTPVHEHQGVDLSGSLQQQGDSQPIEVASEAVADIEVAPELPALTFNGENVQFASLEGFSDFLLLQELSADDLWEIIGAAVNSQVNSQALSPALLRLLWTAARGNINALMTLVRAHALQLVNRPLLLLRTIRFFHRLSARPQVVASGVDPRLWADHLAVLLGDETPSPKKRTTAQEALTGAWEAYVNRMGAAEVRRRIEKIRSREGMHVYVELLEWVVRFDRTRDMPAVTEQSSFQLLYLARRYCPGNVQPQTYQCSLRVLVAGLVALARAEKWRELVALWRAFLATLGVHDPENIEVLTGTLIDVIGHLPEDFLKALIGALSQHSETAVAASVLVHQSGSFQSETCFNCNGGSYRLRQIDCSSDKCGLAGNRVCGFCQKKKDEWHESESVACEGIIDFFSDAYVNNQIRNAMNACTPGTCSGMQEVLLIESTSLLESGNSQIAVALLQAAMALEGINWNGSVNRDALTRWLRQEFFDNPELLRNIMELLSGVSGMEWISIIIREELENHSDFYQNPEG